MTDGHITTVITPSELQGTGEIGPYPVGFFERKCLAQGDSWFSIGALPPGLTTNVFKAPLVLDKSTLIVNCARPGKVLRHMADTTTDHAFLDLLRGPLSTKWDAILLSGGGNDLIDAAHSPPAARRDQRLFLRPDERAGGALPAEAYLSEEGWTTLADHLRFLFDQLVDQRDSGINARVPLVFHDYAYAMPRAAPAGPGFGPWLQPALDAFQIPAGDWLAVSKVLTDRLSTLLRDAVAARQAQDPGCALHLVDTIAANLALAAPGSTGESGDFVNEIHPSRLGYKKVAAAWRQVLDGIL